MFKILRTSFLESRFFEDVFVLALDWNHFLDVSLRSFLPLLERFSHRHLAVSWSSMFHLFMNWHGFHLELAQSSDFFCRSLVLNAFRNLLSSLRGPNVRKDRRVTEGRRGRWASGPPGDYRNSHHPCGDLPFTKGHLLAWSTKAEIYSWRWSNKYWTYWNSMCSEQI